MTQPSPMTRLPSFSRRFWRRLGLVLTSLLAIVLVTAQASPAAKVSNYELAQAQPF
jgi:hypothetical protein